MMTSPRMMATLHPASLFHQPQNTEVCLSDWQRMGKYLRGSWPRGMPEVREWKKGSDVFFGWQHPEFIAIDTEYVVDTGDLLLLGFGTPDGPVIQWWPKREDAVSRSVVRASFLQLVRDYPVVMQNCMADIPIIEKALGIKYTDYKRIDDTLLLHSLLWCEMPHNLEFLASVYGQYEKMKHLPMTDPLYNAGDVLETITVWEALLLEVKHDPQTWWLYENSLLPLVPIILEAQQKGLRVDRAKVKEAERLYMDARFESVRVAGAYAGFPINMGSPKQLKDFLSIDLNKKLKGVDEDEIAKLRSSILPFDPDEENTIDTVARRIGEGGHPLLEARVLFARAQQYLSHYVRPMLESSDGRVYPHFHPWAQNTGRWSTVDPPLAQLPHSLREALIPDDGWVWFEFDWTSIELMLIAALANDKLLLEAFAKKWDVHTVNTCGFFGWELPPIPTKEGIKQCHEWIAEHRWLGSEDPRRTFAKTAVYRLCYGGLPQGAPSIPGAASTGLSSQQLILASQRWINAHPAIRRYWNQIARNSVKHRQLRTFLGRRWNFLSHDLKRIQRQMYDFPMQGAVSDIMNLTLIDIYRSVPGRVRLSYTMHDSLKLQIKITDHIEADIQAIISIAEREWDVNGVTVSVPIEWKRR